MNAPKFPTSITRNITARAELAAEIARAEQLQVQSAERHAQLRDTGNLEDDTVVNEIIRTRAFVELFPGRIQSLYARLAALDKSILAEAAKFNSEVVCPAAGQLIETGRATVRAKLADVGLEQVELDAAIHGSELVRLRRRLATEASYLSKDDGAVAYAEALATLWQRCQEYDKETTPAALAS
jgi:hypothetical protein